MTKVREHYLLIVGENVVYSGSKQFITESWNKTASGKGQMSSKQRQIYKLIKED